MRTLLVIGLVLLAAGCGKPQVVKPLGKSAEHWAEALASPELLTRREAALALKQMGPDAKPALPALIKAVQDDPDGQVRAAAVEALWGLGSEAREAVPVLRAALRDREPGVRLNAAGALGDIGPEAQAAIPDLQSLLRDPDQNVRDTAEKALGKLRGEE